jgi:hypothetical protein
MVMGKVVACVFLGSGILTAALVLFHRATGSLPQFGLYAHTERITHLLGHDLTVRIDLKRTNAMGSQSVQLCPFGNMMVLELGSDLIPIDKAFDRWGQRDSLASKCEVFGTSFPRGER